MSLHSAPEQPPCSVSLYVFRVSQYGSRRAFSTPFRVASMCSRVIPWSSMESSLVRKIHQVETISALFLGSQETGHLFQFQAPRLKGINLPPCHLNYKEFLSRELLEENSFRELYSLYSVLCPSQGQHCWSEYTTLYLQALQGKQQREAHLFLAVV